MKTALRAVASVMALTLPLAGCLDMQQGIQLRPDLSGIATVQMSLDMNGMIPFIAKMQKDMKGEPGEPTEEELAAVRKEILEKQEQDRAQEDADLARKRAELEASLPEGITLERFDVSRDELRMSVRMAFKFDHVSKLPALELPSEPDGDQGAPPGAPSEAKMKKPFENLVVEETADQVTITFLPKSPLTEAEPAEEPGDEGDEGPQGGMPDMARMVEEMTKTVRVAFTVTTPLEVVEGNQTKKEGETLTWSYDKDAITKLEKVAPGDRTSPRVVLRKQK